MNPLTQFINNNGLYTDYNEEYKSEFKKIGRKFCNLLVKELELDEHKISYNPAGIACSGDFSMFGRRQDRTFYLHFNADGICCGAQGFFRTAKDFKDYTGGYNVWFTFTDSIENIIIHINREIFKQF
jgi:hypothetical protein